jgi:hypothetical protein
LIIESSGDDQPNSNALIPANELVVALSNVFTDKPVDTAGNKGGVMGDEEGA